jgi:hypothetical protein
MPNTLTPRPRRRDGSPCSVSTCTWVWLPSKEAVCTGEISASWATLTS